MGPSVDEQGRGRHHAGANAGFEVAAHALDDGVGTAVGLEARQVQAEPAGALPEVRLVEASLVAVECVVHLPEAALPRGRLRGARAGPGPRVLGAHGKVAEDL